ncbi:hypothetical protein CspeluHIS016_0100530 [Cutaneotrichosporon spelunceum]|uniref:Wax synthase domain-containing protein n=1 Tax=Cutaneotrichosporon spelunceum TaxID=1672016 RepID=A0AAD3Y948_9TREE|nr:hypothetical protein CspeluHIS016_0100530 [Cutaneotrichosporon spelunceum]
MFCTGSTAACIVHGLKALRALLPEPRAVTGPDFGLGLLLVSLHILALLPAPTRGWRLTRAALGPLIGAAWAYLGYVPIMRTPQERWGGNLLFWFFAARAIEHLVVFTPEFEVYRLRPVTSRTESKGRRGLEPEPIPQPWTWAKLGWAASLWWSWRGIGWNFAAPLTESQASEPFTRDTPRWHHIRCRLLHLLGVYVLDSLAAIYMHVRMPQFFIAHTLKYAELTTGQRAAVSIATVARIIASVNLSHLQLGLAAVAVGGVFGLKGEVWEPWGWPSMFGSIKDIWRNPGVNYVWAKAWNQYNRRTYHIWAWVGLGEGVLGLPSSGLQLNRHAVARPSSVSVPVLSGATKRRSRPVLSGNISPNVTTPPVSGSSSSTLEFELKSVGISTAQLGPPTPPTSPPPTPGRAGMWANLVKSVLVFTLSGLYHDISSVLVLLDTLGRGENINPWHVLTLSPFFLVQPLAIATEALLVPRYRVIRRKRGIPRHGKSPLLALVERSVGFACVWLWLGWSAGFFVEGMARLGVWRVWEATPLDWNVSLFVPIWNAVM